MKNDENHKRSSAVLIHSFNVAFLKGISPRTFFHIFFMGRKKKENA